MIKGLLNELKNSLFSVLPIYLLMMILLAFKVISFNGDEIFTFSFATMFVILGLTLFNYGAEHAMKPIGKAVGEGLTKKGKIGVLIAAVFIFGFAVTFAEPDLTVLAKQTSSIFNKWVLIAMVSLSVGLFLIVAVTKIIRKTQLTQILAVFYLIAFALTAILCYQGKENMLGLAFDSGGITTGPMTVPFLMALGAGVSSVIAKKSEKDSSFGFIAFASIGPVIVVLLLSIFSKIKASYSASYSFVEENFFISYGQELLSELKSVGESVGILLVCFLVLNFIFLKIKKERLFKLLGGVVLVYFGLVFFLAADSSYVSIGYTIGYTISTQPTWIILLIAFIIGSLTVLAEPAIKILVTQVEETTNGAIKKKYLLRTLALGGGCAISLATARVIFQFSLLYIIVPGYVLCFILSFFVPKIYTAIAFDAGGVASGPLTSSLLLPMMVGLCTIMHGSTQVLSYAFGIIALVALSPILSVELLGASSNVISRISERRAIKHALKEDDKVLICFGGEDGKKQKSNKA